MFISFFKLPTVFFSCYSLSNPLVLWQKDGYNNICCLLMSLQCPMNLNCQIKGMFLRKVILILNM